MKAPKSGQKNVSAIKRQTTIKGNQLGQEIGRYHVNILDK
jgi:hypothetical protein